MVLAVVVGQGDGGSGVGVGGLGGGKLSVPTALLEFKDSAAAFGSLGNGLCRIFVLSFCYDCLSFLFFLSFVLFFFFFSWQRSLVHRPEERGSSTSAVGSGSEDIAEK